MPNLNGVLSMTVQGLQTALAGDVSDIQSFPGQFTEAELHTAMRARRAVRVALGSLPSLTKTGEGRYQGVVQVVVAIICTDDQTEKRHEAAIRIAEKIGKAAIFRRWQDSEDLRPIDAKSIQATNLYRDEVEQQGIALWEVTWQQHYHDHA